MLDLIPLAIVDATDFFHWFIANANYLFVFLFMVIESSFIPFPSEVIVPPAVYLACTNIGVGSEMNPYMVVVVATAGALVGAYINYFLSLWIGRPIVYRFADSRFGHACLINRDKVEKAERYFDRHGAVSTFIGRLIPGIRQLISIPAGLARMNLLTFSAFTVLGALVWNIALAGVGFWLSTWQLSENELFALIEKYNSYLTYIGYGIALLCLLIILWNAFRRRPGHAS